MNASNKIKIEKAYRLLYPRLTVLVTAGSVENKDHNVCTVAWSCPLSANPPLFGIQLTESRYTSVLIEKYQDYCINIPTPSKDLIEASLYVGSVSGRNMQKGEKFKKANLTAQPSKEINAPRIEECAAAIECKLREKVITGDHILYIGEAVNITAKQDAVDAWGLRPQSALYWRNSHKKDTYAIKKK